METTQLLWTIQEERRRELAAAAREHLVHARAASHESLIRRLGRAVARRLQVEHEPLLRPAGDTRR